VTVHPERLRNTSHDGLRFAPRFLGKESDPSFLLIHGRREDSADACRKGFPGRLLATIDAEAGRLADKNAWLGAWIKRKLALRKVRYYQESTIVFDE